MAMGYHKHAASVQEDVIIELQIPADVLSTLDT